MAPQATRLKNYLLSSRIRIDLLSYESKPTECNTTGGLKKAWTGTYTQGVKTTVTSKAVSKATNMLKYTPVWDIISSPGLDPYTQTSCRQGTLAKKGGESTLTEH